MTRKGKIIVIVGPTASGKSDLAIKMARKVNGEIISADSRQVYRKMDIGTGKVSKKEQKMIRHHLLDVANPKRQFSASDFKKLGEKAIQKILAKGKIPVIVGGTGFYVDILLGRMNVAEVPPNKKLRAELEKQSAEQLFKRLSALDPLRAESIDRHNKYRLIRALEIYFHTKKSSIRPVYAIPDHDYSVLWLGINPGKEKLSKNIKKRLDERLKKGMLGEVKKLRGQGVSWKRLDDLGLEYRWMSRWLIQNLKIKMQNDNAKLKKFQNSEEYKNLLRDIVRYSKRQMTWFKRNKEIHWLTEPREAGKLLELFLQ